MVMLSYRGLYSAVAAFPQAILANACADFVIGENSASRRASEPAEIRCGIDHD